jgi:hypothetical protein
MHVHERVRKAPLPWLAGGLLLGLVQIAAISLYKPLEVSTSFVVIQSKAVHEAAPVYAQNHELIKNPKYQEIGYGFWLVVGICCGACLASLAAGRWRLRSTMVWWRINHGPSLVKRFLAAFLGGVLILLGARFAHGCTSGQFASGWAQLSLSVVPFTVTFFAAAVLTAYFVYPRVPPVEK